MLDTSKTKTIDHEARAHPGDATTILRTARRDRIGTTTAQRDKPAETDGSRPDPLRTCPECGWTTQLWSGRMAGLPTITGLAAGSSGRQDEPRR